MVTISFFAGDIAEGEADAICTSTNPRLTLVMGTGAAVRARGGFGILRECEAIVERYGPLAPGSAHVTTAGELSHKVAIHCVASDLSHRSSGEVIRLCVVNALARAASADCRSIAMPVFGAGHARVPFATALGVIVSALRERPFPRVLIAINDADRLEQARAMFPELDMVQSEVESDDESVGWWSVGQ
jgi:O-acetyl-ADP-ribose deacetylase (regulator of RNase III)